MSERKDGKQDRKIQIWEEEAISLEGDMTRKEKVELTDRVLRRMRQEAQLEGKQGGKEYAGWRNLWRGVAAVLLVALLVPGGAYAYGRIQQYFQASVKREGYQVEMPIATSKEQADKVSVLENVEPVRLDLGDLSGYQKHKQVRGDAKVYGYGYWLYRGEDFDGLVECDIIRVDREVEKDLMIKDVAESRQIKIGKHHALYARYNDVVDSKYTVTGNMEQELYVFYDDLGYILRYYNNGDYWENGKSQEENLLDFAGKARLVTCSKDRADGSIKLTDYIKWREEEAVPEKKVAPSGKQIYSGSETVEWDGTEYRVLDVKVMDSVKNLMKSDSRCFLDKKKLLKCVDQDQRLISYKRETVKKGDGKKEPIAKVEETKDVQLKFVEVTLRMKNVSGNLKRAEMNQQITFLKGNEEYEYAYGENVYFSRPDKVLEVLYGSTYREEGYEMVYFEERDKKSSYFPGNILLEDQEARVYHIGFLADEDQLNQMYLTLPWGSARKLDKYIDIRQ